MASLVKGNSEELETIADSNKIVVKAKADDFSIDGSIDELKGRFLIMKQNIICPLQI